MPHPRPLPQDQLLTRLEIFEDRLNDLENEVLDGKPALEKRLAKLEELVGEATPKKAKKARFWMFTLTGIAIALAAAPQKITLGSIIYQTGGIPIEGILAIIAAWPTLEAIWLSVKKDS